LSDDESLRTNQNPLIVIGDKIQPKTHLVSLLQHLRTENGHLPEEDRIQYAVCKDSTQVALALRRYLGAVKMILLGPDLIGNSITVARMLSKKAKIVVVIDPRINPLGRDPDLALATQKNLDELGVIVTTVSKADGDFFAPIVNDYVVSGMAVGIDLESMTPEERGRMIDMRLDAVNTFPSLPETQRKVAELDDLDPPKRWAEAIDPDVPTRTVILRLLNSARYSFRARVETIEQAVALASARTIREIVTACQMRQILQKTTESTIDQYWRHSLATAFFAKLLSLPADPAEQSSQQKSEFERFQLEDDQVAALREGALWTRLELHEKDDTFTSGLLHDIGKITMIMCLEDSLKLVNTLIESEAQEAQESNELWAHSIIDIERFLMQDIDHQVIGSRLAEKWELSPGIIQVIGHHHDITEQSPDLLKIVALADLAGNCLFPYPGEKHHPFPALFERIDKAVKGKIGARFDQAVEEVLNEEIGDELAHVIGKLNVPDALWTLIDHKRFFKLCYITAPKIKSTAIAFLQQTA
jgi:HD-like signal output (HDOD) protein